MDSYSPSMRVLVRPPSAPSLPPQPPPQPPPLSTPLDFSSSSPHSDIVVVGFVAKRHHDVAYLINKIIDSNVFGSGNLDSCFPFLADSVNEELNKWLRSRKLSLFHDKGKGILYLQFSSENFPVSGEVSSGAWLGCDSGLEEHEFGDLQGLLFVFSVCHIIIFIQDGSRFDTRTLKKFRILQAAKQTMAPYLRSQNKLTVTSKSHTLASSQITTIGASLNNPSPGKTRGILNRNTSTVTLMSGLGSYTSLLPGQCVPIMLFVFLDDFTDIQHSGTMEEPAEASSSNLPSNLINSIRSGGSAKGSCPVVVLARPVNKSEGGLRKKLQSSLEAQIRFSLKKCRTLSGSEGSHTGSRSSGMSGSAPLFTLDASKAVSLVDANSNQSGESLEFAIALVEEVLEGRATSDSLLLESHQHTANKEDIISVKEFIYKQCDTLRGRGGLIASSSSGSSAGVGMVAVAAAAAAASAASAKKINTPELPTLETWSSSCQNILLGILSTKRLSMNEVETSKTREQDMLLSPKTNMSGSPDPLESAVSRLGSVTSLNIRFSILWCQKAFPAAKEVYLEGLPPCYPSSQHDVHLKKALRVFTLMVKGPAVQLYMKKLKDECTSIWSSGRQQCDAVSLTGKPCIHQKHDLRNHSANENTHSSGFMYLHACACGRSRNLRPDPFNYETANVVNNLFPDCDKLLPMVRLPEQRYKGPIQPSSWNLIRIGSAKYYEPSKGLLQSGFSVTEKFLLRWSILLKNLKEANIELSNDPQKVSLDRSINVVTFPVAETKISDGAQSRLTPGEVQNGAGMQMRHPSSIMETEVRNTAVGRGSPNFTMKPFSEVVSGSPAANSGFPPLFSRKAPFSVTEKGSKEIHTRLRGLEKIGEIVENEEFQNGENEESLNVGSNGSTDKEVKNNRPASHVQKYGNPHVSSTSGQIVAPSSMSHVTMYVGFEHECSHGHRFILSLDHLNESASSSISPEENVVVCVGNSDQRQDPLKSGKINVHGKTRRQPNGTIMGGAFGKAKHPEKSKERLANGNVNAGKVLHPTRPQREQANETKASDLVEISDSFLQSTSINDGICAFSLINTSLPLYMNCPYCRDSTSKSGTSSVKFASRISQLQRIFVVTPSFPILLAANPLIQFEVSCLPSSIPDREQKLQFSLGCPVILPPDSFLSLRLPFVYGVELEDGSFYSLKPSENQPQLTACVMKGTTLQIVNRSNLDV